MNTIKPIVKSIREWTEKHPVAAVALLSGLAGGLLGWMNSDWQVTVETGQVIAGLVKYPADNPFYMYHIKVFSIINYISALLLLLTRSEMIVTVIISILMGMIALQSLSMIIFAINRSISISVLGALFIYFTNYVGSGAVYPIDILGHGHTYGAIALSYIVLVIALIAARAYGAGLFLLALAPAVHPSMGSWLCFSVLLAALFDVKFVIKVLKENYRYFLAGILVAAASLGYQLFLMRGLPVINPEMKEQYLKFFIKYWDCHRRKVYWDYGAGVFRFFKSSVIICVYSVIAGFLGQVYFKKEKAMAFMFRVICLSGILAMLTAGLTHLPFESVPKFLLMFMPGRYMNFNNVIFVALLIGMLTYRVNQKYMANYLVFIVFTVLSMAILPELDSTSRSMMRKMWICVLVAFPVIVAWLVYLGRKGRFPATNVFLLAYRTKRSYSKAFFCIMAFFIIINLKNTNFVLRHFGSGNNLKDRTNDPFYSTISKRKGLMAITDYSFLVGLKTRRPVLIDPSALDGFSMVPESGDVMDNVLKKVYGVSLLKPPPKRYRNMGILSWHLHKYLWRFRTMEEWQKIRKEFGVTDVLMSNKIKVLLPRIAVDDEKGVALYHIPGEGEMLDTDIKKWIQKAF